MCKWPVLYSGLITNRCFFDVIYTTNFDISCMGKWVPLPDTRGAYPTFRIFDSEIKYTKYLTCCRIRARESGIKLHTHVS